MATTLAGLIAPLAVGCDRRDRAPDVGYTLLDGTLGQTSALRGQVVLVSFWATSCGACVNEMPNLVATHHKFQARGYTTLAVAMRYDPPALVSHFAQTRQLPFAVVIDNTGAMARAFGNVQVTPTHFLIDRRGAIAQRLVGAPAPAALHALITPLLAESSSASA